MKTLEYKKELKCFGAAKKQSKNKFRVKDEVTGTMQHLALCLCIRYCKQTAVTS